jgi:hypothetical protein
MIGQQPASTIYPVGRCVMVRGRCQELASLQTIRHCHFLVATSNTSPLVFVPLCFQIPFFVFVFFLAIGKRWRH